MDRPAFDDWLEPANEVRQFPLALAAINRVTEGLRAEVHLHCCHSVSKRKSDVTGDYRPILPLLRDARVDRVNLEFAYPGTGDVGDLHLLPDHLGLGMGVVDVRRESVPSVEEIETLAAAGGSGRRAGADGAEPRLRLRTGRRGAADDRRGLRKVEPAGHRRPAAAGALRRGQPSRTLTVTAPEGLSCLVRSG